MRFNEKLNLLMKMSNTTNMLLAEALGIDPSLVSRWRTGSRDLSTHSRYIQAMGIYFASRAKLDFQRVALLELTGHTFEEKDVPESVIAGYLSRWLTNDSKITSEAIETLLDTISQSTSVDSRIPHSIELPPEPSGTTLLAQSFTGIKGLQEASIKLLMRAASIGSQAKLLLYSDEPMDWINSYPSFARMWAYLLMNCIRKGAKIQIIHTLARDSNELAIALEKWLPFYFSGAVNSYYYPRKLDSLFHHTHFVLQGHAAVTSFSVRGQDRHTIQYSFSTDVNYVKSIENLFVSELEQCRQLVQTMTGKALSQIPYQRAKFFSQPGTMCAGMELLPTIGLPITTLDHILERYEVPVEVRNTVIEQNKKYQQALIEHAGKHDYTILLSLPRISDVLKERVRAGAAELQVGHECYYTVQEYLEHVRHIVELLNTYENVNVGIVPKKYMIPNVHAFAKPGAGMVVLKQNEPMFAFVSEQRDLTIALYRHIMQQASRLPKRERAKDFVIKRLETFIEKIESALDQHTHD
ncbi:MAG: hypothetical protein RBT04_05335 [Sphaerochaetaceae bacterium]|nr:hypothetical protein [Sphaerochaetaceae bacterium]